jgi:hypothetical protein
MTKSGIPSYRGGGAVEKAYQLMILGPPAAICVFGLLAPIARPIFAVGVAVIAVVLIYVLVYHERALTDDPARFDPFPNYSEWGYILGGLTLSTAFVLQGRANGTPALVGVYVDVSTISAFLGITLVPLISVLGTRLALHKRRHILIASCISVGLAIGIGIVISPPFTWSGEFKTNLIVAGMVFGAGLVAFVQFIIILNMPAGVVKAISERREYAWLVPITVSVADIVTIVQGLTGLAEHYAAFRGVALGGILGAFLSIALALGFSGFFARGSLKPRGAAHVLLASAVSVTLAVVLLYVLGEAAGLVWMQARNVTQ